MDRPFFCDLTLARRLECVGFIADRLGYQAAAVGLYPDAPPQAVPVAGGMAFFNAPGSLLNTAMGLGLNGPVALHELRAMDAFFDAHGAAPKVEVCPLADDSLEQGLLELGYRPGRHENVLVVSLARAAAESGEPCAPYGRRVPPGPTDPRVRVRTVPAQQRREWGRLMARGFSAPVEPDAAEYEICDIVARVPSGVVYVMAEVDGEPAGTGCVTIADGMAMLNGDTTLPQFRRLGVQEAVQGVRLDLGVAAACDLGVSEATPGSVSQRNQERHGFRVAFTRTTWEREAAARGLGSRERQGTPASV